MVTNFQTHLSVFYLCISWPLIVSELHEGKIIMLFQFQASEHLTLAAVFIFQQDLVPKRILWDPILKKHVEELSFFVNFVYRNFYFLLIL